MRFRCAFSALLALTALGCEPVDPVGDLGQPSFADRELALRRGPPSRRDGGVIVDAGVDAGFDAGRDSGVDAGRDGGFDAGRDGGVDSGAVDSGAVDSGAVDSGAVDSGAVDAGAVDSSSGPHDAGVLCGTWRGRAPIRTLFVGNSQIDVWSLPDIVEDVAGSAPPSCPRIEPTYFTWGGANLRDLWTRPLPDGRRLPQTIASGAYDVIVITESIDLAEFRPPYPEQFVTDATAIIDAARAAGSVPVLYATSFPEWGGSNGFHMMADPQLALGHALGVTVAAGGLAWFRVWAEEPRIDLYASDRAHPSHEGSYISSLVIYSAITGASPIGLTHDLVVWCGAHLCPPIRDADAELYQRAAWAQHLATGL